VAWFFLGHAVMADF